MGWLVILIFVLLADIFFLSGHALDCYLSTFPGIAYSFTAISKTYFPFKVPSLSLIPLDLFSCDCIFLSVELSYINFLSAVQRILKHQLLLDALSTVYSFACNFFSLDDIEG